MYDCEEYASSRLVGTLVLHEDKAVKVLSVGGSLTCLVCYVAGEEEGEQFRVDLSELSLKSPALGFVNFGNRCGYLVRKPMRHDWRQGVRPNSVQDLHRGNVTFSTIGKCMEGVFPTFKEALVRIEDGVPEVAISRDFSIVRRGGVLRVKYKWYGKVGRLNKNGVALDDKFNHLKKCVEKLL